MIFESFNHWKDRQPPELIGTPEHECADCDGEGEYECGCCGHDRECDTCDGSGIIEYKEHGRVMLGKMYLEDIASTAKDLCYFAGRGDFFDLMGDFIKEHGRPDMDRMVL